MRWENLFDDLESQLDSERSAEESDLLIEEERARQSRLGMRDRLRSLLAGGASKQRLKLALTDGSSVLLEPSHYGQDWMAGDLVESSNRRTQCILSLDGVAGLQLESDQIPASLMPLPDETAGQLSAKLTLPFVLRDLCRRRAFVELRLVDRSLRGTIDRVGRDHLDLAVHEPGAPRRESLVQEYRIVRLAELVLVRL